MRSFAIVSHIEHRVTTLVVSVFNNNNMMQRLNHVPPLFLYGSFPIWLSLLWIMMMMLWFRSECTALTTASSSRTAITRTKDNVSIHEDYLTLPNGMTMQVLVGMPPPSARIKKQPSIVLFLHGSFHAAWCWEEHSLPFFSRAGYITVAPSWRGTGGSPCINAKQKKIPIHEHVDDLWHLRQSLSPLLRPHLSSSSAIQITDATPVHVVGHSFGGMVLMKYCEQHFAPSNAAANTPFFRSLALLCSVPPSGNGRMTQRFVRRSIRDSWAVTRGLAMKQCCHDAKLCRQLFFSTPAHSEEEDTTNGITDADVARYQTYFVRDSRVVIDLFDLARRLPSAQTTPQGEALFVANAEFPPCLVVGARHDFIVDAEGNRETARYFGCYDEGSNDDRLFQDRSTVAKKEPRVVLLDSPHDVMLGDTWIHGAQLLLQWLQQNA